MKFIKNMQILRAFHRVGTCLSDIFTMSVTDNNYVWTTGQEKIGCLSTGVLPVEGTAIILALTLARYIFYWRVRRTK